MNNLEIFDDFIEMFKLAFPGAPLDERDEHIIRMAINHACLVLQTQPEQAEKLREIVKHITGTDEL